MSLHSIGKKNEAIAFQIYLKKVKKDFVVCAV